MDEMFQLLGRAPRPATGDALAARLREVLADEAADVEWIVSGLEAMTVRAHMDGPDIGSLTLDLTGLEATIDVQGSLGDDATLDDERDGDDEGEPPGPAVVGTEPGTLGRATVRARPVLVQGVPVAIEVDAEHIAFEWVEFDDGSLAVRLQDRKRRLFRWKPSNLRVRGSVEVEAATSAMADALRLLLRTEGLDMDRERISLRTVGSGRLRLDASARFKWKFLRPRFRLRTTLRFGNRNAVRIVGTKITSSNLLFHLPLLLFRPRINKELRQAFDLDDAIAPWSIRDLRVRAGRRLDVDVQLTRPGH